MKRWFRPIAYSIILILVGLAVFSKPPPTVGAENGGAAHDAATRPSLAAPATPLATAALRPRSNEELATGLFAASRAAPPPVPAAPAPVAADPPKDLKILGWMQSDAVPYVFVEYNGESYTLSPTQTVDDVYRFDKIGNGLAEFTYLPTNQPRQYTVSDPTVLE